MLNPKRTCAERGNVLFIILLAVGLLGLVTAAIQYVSKTGTGIDREALTLHISQIKSYTAELHRGLQFIMQNGVSESDIRFSHPDADSEYGDLSSDPDPSNQMFHADGGGATYRLPPSGINNGDRWEFYGNTALPDIGSDEAELIVVMPNVTQAFCQAINKTLDYDENTQPLDSGTCINTGTSARFDDATQFSLSPNTVSTATFTITPPMQGCVQCADNTYHYFYVLIAR